MFLRIFSAFLSLVLMLIGISVPAQTKSEAKFTGTFIQSWLCLWWDEETWALETAYMKEAGIDTLILQNVADFSDADTAELHYQSNLPCFADCEKYGDVIEDCLKACQKSGIDVFVGLSVFDDWWTFAGLTSEYNTVCEKSAMMAEEIYNLYYEKYKDTFKGWYFSPEINNIPTMKLSILNISNGFNIILDKVNALNPDLPMMLSPYYTEYISVPSVLAALPMWEVFMNAAHLRDGDIFCPQDAIGAGWVREQSLEKMWKMYAAAVDSCPADVLLWANCECMTVGREEQIFMPPATVETENATATLDRLIRQMETASHYVDKIVTFSYCHYLSPVTVSDVYHRTYLDYLENGVLENTAPDCVAGLHISDDTLVWDAASDNIGIAYYLVSVDGTDTIRVEGDSELFSCPAQPGHTYAVTAVDAAGNKSGSVSLVF